MKNNEDIVYRQVQFIGDEDNRSFEERHASLPFIRDEELADWEEWWNRTLGDLTQNNVHNN